MFAVGCYNCHCLLFFAGTHNTTYSATSNEGRTPRALDDAHSQLGDHPGLVLFRTHTQLHILHTHTHHGVRGYEIETLVVVPDSYIPLHTVTRFMQSLLIYERKDGNKMWAGQPHVSVHSGAAKEGGERTKERKTEESRERKSVIILFVCVYTNASQPIFVSKGDTNELIQ